MMSNNNGDILNDVEKKTYKFRTCNICGCKQYTTNFSRHSKAKKHKESDYAYHKFEIENTNHLRTRKIQIS